MKSACASIRESIRWLPNEPSEPTDTIVLTGLHSGYRSSDGPVTIFKHCIDSRTLNPLDVVDQGTNKTLPSGTIVESGEMINPSTSLMTSYEEVWRDEEHDTGIFMRNSTSSEWRAMVGCHQLALGRTNDHFWAWQAVKGADGWKLQHSFGFDGRTTLLPDHHLDWATQQNIMLWDGDLWSVFYG
ncbi:unnamed protein product [Mycena citricolor]|uniref:Uncharacterized protein n=1 Tax=Mycena citricolor TaxID=2018698 RepID=A0AAD2HBN9_9AGAR|nr:unnamed protein product [Mycena citricolor]CAK5271820.1 unnamed protein product [Mycena citricolor]